MSELKNIIVGQSGGPTAAINATLAGVIRAGVESEKVGKVYGMVNGIAGMIDKKIVKLDELGNSNEKIELLKKTPSSYLGSCRMKLPQEDKELYEKIFAILEEYNIGCFFYIGGNDSMDTANKLSKYAKENGKDINFVGVAKTVDNDLPEMDHTPGFGSAAKYIATTVKEIILDAGVYDLKSVEIVEVMGRDAGWLAGASVLANPDLIYLPECEFDIEKFYTDVDKKLKEKNHVLVVASEGIRTKDGKYICNMMSEISSDAFGHQQLGGTGKVLEKLVKEKFGVKVRSIELSTPQRCASHILSKTDIDESFNLGYSAVGKGISGKTGIVMAIKRVSDNPYTVSYEAQDVDKVANIARCVPDDYINEEKNFVTDKFVHYITPLVEGEIALSFKKGIPEFLVLDI